ncbi:unnamed protein product [Alopecurus aequalis]
MLPFSTAPAGGHRARDTASSPAFLAFAVLLAALFLVCLLSAAARRLCSRRFASTGPPSAAAPPRRCRGAAVDPADLPVRAHAGAEGDVCAVCLGELRAEEQVKAIPACGHVFHPPCIDRWLVLAATAGRASSCPLCRRSVAAAFKPAAPAA